MSVGPYSLDSGLLGPWYIFPIELVLGIALVFCASYSVVLISNMLPKDWAEKLAARVKNFVFRLTRISVKRHS